MSERAHRLEQRVRWLDRQRRFVAILAGLALAVFIGATIIDADWPRIHTTALSMMAGFAGWLIAEVALASITAVWEIELDRLLVLRGLPRAEAAPRRWRWRT